MDEKRTWRADLRIKHVVAVSFVRSSAEERDGDQLYSPAFRFPPPRKPTGAKFALKAFHVWGTRVRLQVGSRARDLALFDLALDGKLGRCDLRRSNGERASRG